MAAAQRTVLFVYNADSGIGNALLDVGHKIVSPSTYNCRLCALTHGVFTVRDQWKAFVESLPVPAEFLHRDEFRARHSLPDLALPAVLIREPDSTIRELIPAGELNSLASLDELEQTVRHRLRYAQQHEGEGLREQPGDTAPPQHHHPRAE